MTDIDKKYAYYDGLVVNELEHLEEVSSYNRNYYKGIGKDLLFSSSDDEDNTEWYVIRGSAQPIYIGYSMMPYGAPEYIKYSTEIPS